METPFYHDDVLSGLGSGFAPSSSGSSGLLLPFPGGSMMKKDALGLPLPEQVAAALKAPGATAAAASTAGGGDAPSAGLLGSAELGLLKLASPELERLIIQSNGLVTTTPTSGQFLYPKAAASEEQEFAEGFVKALEDLHKQNQLGGAAAAAGGGGGGGGGGAGELPAAGLAPEPPVYANLSSYPAVSYAAAEGRAADRARGAELRREPAAVAHRHGHAGAHQGGAEAAAEPHRRLQVPQEEAGAHLAPGGEGEEPQEPEHRAGLHRQPAPRAGGTAQAEGAQPRQQRLPAPAAAPAPGAGLLSPAEAGTDTGDAPRTLPGPPRTEKVGEKLGEKHGGGTPCHGLEGTDGLRSPRADLRGSGGCPVFFKGKKKITKT
uniref:JunD proto-oncogene, AP-1 transcription factor subunit n=1 Tax=Cairina moschata TaxID=8855 RepID=A0A8C3BQP0_CAIMO